MTSARQAAFGTGFCISATYVFLACVLVLSIASGDAQESKSKNQVEIIKTPAVINRLNLTGHGPKDLIILGYENDFTSIWRFYKMVLVDLSFDPTVKSDNAPVQEHQLVQVYEMDGQPASFVVDEWDANCEIRENLFFRSLDKGRRSIFLVKGEIMDAPDFSRENQTFRLTKYELRETFGGDRGRSRFYFEAVSTKTVPKSLCSESDVSAEIIGFARTP